MENEFPGNAHRQIRPGKPKDEEPKKIERVTNGEVVRRKKPFSKRISETFIGDDAGSVWQYVAFDVLLPAAKDMVADAVSQGVERMIFGEARSTSRRTGSRPGGSSGYVSYNRYSSGSSRDQRPEPRMSPRNRATHNFDEIILPTRVEAEEVIDQMFEIVSRFEVVSVADLYKMVGIEPSYVDDQWGWTDLRGAGPTRVRNGYLLDLPPTESLK